MTYPADIPALTWLWRKSDEKTVEVKGFTCGIVVLGFTGIRRFLEKKKGIQGRGMNISRFSITILLIPVLTGMVSCNSSEPALPVTYSGGHNISEISTGRFIPGVVLLTIPLYPESEPTTFMEWQREGGPPASSVSSPLYANENRPGYQAASAQYKVDSSSMAIMSWYEEILGEMGYKKYAESKWGMEKVSGWNTGFYLPSQPLVSVEVHTYQTPSFPSLVYELLVVNTIPLPKPEQEAIPRNINRIEIDYTGYLETAKPKRTITDNETIAELINMVNSLPVMPDFVFLGGTGGPQTVFTVVFHSGLQGNITVTKVLGGINTGINIEGYPVLDDPHNLLHDRVKELIQNR